MDLYEFTELQLDRFAASELTCPVCGADALDNDYDTTATRVTFDGTHHMIEEVTCGACHMEMELIYELKGFARRRDPLPALSDASLDFWAESCGLEFEWAPDWGVNHVEDYGYDEDPETCESCRLYDPDTGETLASLCCIDDATEDYRRSIERDLCQEAYQARIRRIRK